MEEQVVHYCKTLCLGRGDITINVAALLLLLKGLELESSTDPESYQV